MLEPEFALYLIDMRHFQAREVIEFLRMRNRSPIAHVPVLLYVPPGVELTREEDAMLGRLIGVRAGEEVNGLPVPYRIDDLENTERIKHLVQGILKVDDNIIQQGYDWHATVLPIGGSWHNSIRCRVSEHRKLCR